MVTYLVRRLLYAIPVVVGVNLFTFALFFMVNSPDDIARAHLGNKYVSEKMIANWKAQHDYDKPLFINQARQGVAKLTDTLFFIKSIRLFAFEFGMSDGGRDIGADVRQRMLPSLMIAVPVLLLGLLTNITIAMLMTFFRGTRVELVTSVMCIAMMSVSTLFYIIIGQYVVARLLRLVPISGYSDGWFALKFILLPVVISVVAGIGSSARWYKTIFIEEIYKDYVRTARAKGLSELKVMLNHVLQNAMIPILTGIVVIIPLLFLGSLLMESFFGIPGMGSYTIDAISLQDFAIVRVIVFLGTLLYIFGLILTDLSYILVDPRVRLD